MTLVTEFFSGTDVNQKHRNLFTPDCNTKYKQVNGSVRQCARGSQYMTYGYYSATQRQTWSSLNSTKTHKHVT